jgi:nitrogen fixation NifU-like protein
LVAQRVQGITSKTTTLRIYPLHYNRCVYTAKLLDHFEHPRNVGEIAGPDASVRVENPACGDIMQLTLKLTGGRIAEARYRTRGCVAAIACGSAMTEMLIGLTPAEAAVLKRSAIVEAVGSLPNESTHASHLAIDALKAALKQMDH